MRRIGLLALVAVGVLVLALAQGERPARSSGSDTVASATPGEPAPIPTVAADAHSSSGSVRVRNESDILSGTSWTVAETRGRLRSQRRSVREQALKVLLLEDIRDSRLLPELADLIERDLRFDSYRAMIVWMRTLDSREHVRTLAERATTKRDRGVVRLLLQLDPESAWALVRAVELQQRTGSNISSVDSDRIEEITNLLVESPRQGVEELVKTIQGAKGAALEDWIQIASGIRPLPPQVGEILARAVQDNRLTGSHYAVRVLMDPTVDFSATAPLLARALALRLESSTDSEKILILQSLRNMKQSDPGILAALTREVVVGDEAVSKEALEVLRALGQEAEGAVLVLIEHGKRLPPPLKREVTRVLLATGSDQAMPYLLLRLDQAPREEQQMIVDSLAEVQGAAKAIDALGRIVQGRGDLDLSRSAIKATARIDPVLSDPRVEGLLLRAMQDPRWQLRVAGLQATQDLTRLSQELFDEIIARLEDARSEVASAAKGAVVSIGRLEGEAKPFLKPLLQLTRSDETRKDHKFYGGMLETVAALDVSDAQVRAALFEGLGKESLEIKKAALRGISRIDVPSSAEYRKVASSLRYPSLTGLIKEVVSKPGWEGVRATTGLRLPFKIGK